MKFSPFPLKNGTIPPINKQMQHTGHRQRLKDRFFQNGAMALHDYELLELILFLAIPRKDVKPLAKALLQHYQTLNNLLTQQTNDLALFPGLGQSGALSLKLAQGLALKITQETISESPILNHPQQLTHYARLRFPSPHVEQFLVFYLNDQGHYLGDKILASGTLDDVLICPREIVRTALSYNATGIILVHNHPHGDATPSAADIETTKQLVHVLTPLRIKIRDHLIIGRADTFSFHEAGYV